MHSHWWLALNTSVLGTNIEPIAVSQTCCHVSWKCETREWGGKEGYSADLWLNLASSHVFPQRTQRAAMVPGGNRSGVWSHRSACSEIQGHEIKGNTWDGCIIQISLKSLCTKQAASEEPTNLTALVWGLYRSIRQFVQWFHFIIQTEKLVISQTVMDLMTCLWFRTSSFMKCWGNTILLIVFIGSPHFSLLWWHRNK